MELLTVFLYKILHGALDIPPNNIDIIQHTGRTTHGSYPWKLSRVPTNGKWQSSRHAGVEYFKPHYCLCRLDPDIQVSVICQALGRTRTLQPSVVCIIRGGQPPQLVDLWIIYPDPAPHNFHHLNWNSYIYIYQKYFLAVMQFDFNWNVFIIFFFFFWGGGS